MTRRVGLAALVAVCSSCLDLSVPKAPGPGTIQGSLVVALTGRPGFQPAPRATALVLGAGLEAAADGEGRFTVGGVTSSSGRLLLTSDSNGDGKAERQRLLSLEAIGARAGRDVFLGQVALSVNGAIRGRVLREGVVGVGGLGGTTVFIPGGSWNTRTGDDGSFVLGDLPEGSFQVAFFEPGFEPASLETALGPAEDKTLPNVRLTLGTTAPASVKGQVRTASGPAADATARLRGAMGERALPVDAEGRFTVSGLPVGLYSFSFERPGSIGVSLINVLLPPGETDFGAITLADGMTRPIALVETPPFDGGTGAGGGSAGGSAGGVAGGAGGGSAGGSAGGVAGGAGGGSAGGSAGGSGGGAGGGTAGGTAGGSGGGSVDAGIVPVAVASGPAFVAANSTVTVTGLASTGVFPLTYRWTQRAGPPVTVMPNNSLMAQSTFTAPGVGNVVELSLVVVDQLGVSSQPSIVRVGVGGAPVARFVPDGGLVAGGQLLPLTSTSFDDAGLPIVAYDWQLAPGSGGVLTVDGGTATWRAPAVAFGAPDELAGISLSVTNSIGVRSNTFSQFWTVRGANPNNWSLDAGVVSPILVGRPTPTVVLRSAVSASVAMPQFSLAWSCTPAMPLVSPDASTPQFIAPVVVGADVPVTCQVVATGQAPLDPPTLSRSVAFVLRDGADPQVVSSSLELARAKPFGFQVTGDERLSSGSASGGCTSTLPLVVGRSVMFGYRNTAQPLQTCAPVTVSLGDTVPAPNTNTSPSVPVGPSNSTVAQFEWVGPFESTDTFDDPRPLVASLGVLPEARQQLFGVDPATTPGFELVATQGGQLVRFGGLDLSAQPTCAPTCPLTSTPVLSGLASGASPRGTRVSWSGAELVVTTSTDGGVSPTLVRRSPTGTWSTFPALAGSPAAWDEELHSVRVSGTDVLVDTWSTDLQTVRRTEVAATGLTQVSQVESTQNRVFIVSGPTSQLIVRERNPSLLTWTTRTTAFSNVSNIILSPTFGGVQFVGIEHGTPASLTLLRVDTPGFGNSYPIGAVEGSDVFVFGNTSFLVYGAGGDVRFRAVRADPLAGGSGFSDFGGPPRPGFSPPFPVMLDVTPACEAAWPRFSFVNEVLVITWQERCAPATRWKVMARVLR
ncbi:MAG: carboxypeptidase-like regulatory domain-containing protein [Myxococcaceae bacterium]|nr:carboxypeptidase-like regulatory domain-containing protein [Myxococcaceae bacterium]